MSYKTKRRTVNGIIYIVLGLVVAAIMCVTVVTFISARKPRPAPPEVTDGGNESGDDDTDTDSDTEGKDGNDDKTVGGDETVDYHLPADGHVMKKYSMDEPVWSTTMCDYRAHTGIDVSAPIGSPVYSIGDGVILEITDDPFNGKCISVGHAGEVTSYYMNVSEELPDGIEVGTTVSSGQIIASVGDTSLLELADSDHLHFAMKAGNDWTDPELYMDFSEMPTSDTPSGNE